MAGGDLWRAAEKVAHDYRIGIYFLKEIERHNLQSLVAS